MDGSKCRASLVRLLEGIEEKGPLVSRLAARACRSSAEDSAEARRLVTGSIITIIIMFAPVRGVAVAGEAEIMALPGVREVNAKRVLLTLLFGGGSQLQLEACTGTWRTRHHVRLPTGSCSIPYALPQHLERGLLRDKVRTGRPASGSGQHLVASSSMPPSPSLFVQ